MKRLIVYDDSGYIYVQIAEPRVPDGKINFLEIDEENYNGKIIKSVDVSVTPNTVILEDIPKSELEIANEKIQALEQTSVEVMNLLAAISISTTS